MSGDVIDQFEPSCRKDFARWLEGWVEQWYDGRQIEVRVNQQTGHAIVIETNPHRLASRPRPYYPSQKVHQDQLPGME